MNTGVAQQHFAELDEDETQLLGPSGSAHPMTALISIWSRCVKFTIGILASAPLGIIVTVRSTP